ncbi:hypothetical protein EF912_18120 [Streptomyces sp. WAC07061]|uniref:cofilin family protein n=1 Tax=Streptomyces sp. WAC07061 TaxID=2487410 RepID=UPI000F78172C|nr:cofilin family protein [Streptomyces sp. WAC07061]RSS53543.1 hypothetical protein EF912_18120 [Streptomyces sp. WAC07061]
MFSEPVVEESVIELCCGMRPFNKVNAVVCRLNSDFSMFVLDSAGTWTHDELLARLPNDEPRYVIYELAFTPAAGKKERSLVIQISWVPRGVELMPMLLSISGTLRSRLSSYVGVSDEVKAIERNQLQYDALVARYRN